MMEVVLVETVGATRMVTVHRPEARNALTHAVVSALQGAVRAAADDASVRCIVLTGAGEHFCAGADLRGMLAEDPHFADHLEEYMDAFHGLVRAVVRCEKPTIAMMDGAAVGFGADLALSCDLRVCSSRAYLQEKFVRVGLMPDGGGTFWLPRLVGTARAMRMILLAEKVDASTLKDLGVAVNVVEAGALREATLTIARELEAGPPLAFAAIKRSVYASWGSIEDALLRERREQLELLRSADAMEGANAWIQKREPRFEGR
jgi:enoyl-CoA hydratase/carnithine racemase